MCEKFNKPSNGSTDIKQIWINPLWTEGGGGHQSYKSMNADFLKFSYLTDLMNSFSFSQFKVLTESLLISCKSTATFLHPMNII